jgi:hypothetical protein
MFNSYSQHSRMQMMHLKTTYQILDKSETNIQNYKIVKLDGSSHSNQEIWNFKNFGISRFTEIMQRNVHELHGLRKIRLIVQIAQLINTEHTCAGMLKKSWHCQTT